MHEPQGFRKLSTYLRDIFKVHDKLAIAGLWTVKSTGGRRSGAKIENPCAKRQPMRLAFFIPATGCVRQPSFLSADSVCAVLVMSLSTENALVLMQARFWISGLAIDLTSPKSVLSLPGFVLNGVHWQGTFKEHRHGRKDRFWQVVRFRPGPPRTCLTKTPTISGWRFRFRFRTALLRPLPATAAVTPARCASTVRDLERG